jgi:hypothetical protein
MIQILMPVIQPVRAEWNVVVPMSAKLLPQHSQ